MQATEKIWMNGELVDWDDAKIHVGAHGLHYGTGVFEGIRCYDTPQGPAVFRLRDHLERLAQLGEAPLHGAAVLRRRAARRLHGPDLRERPAVVLPAPARVLRLRRARRRGARQPGRRRDHELAVGHVPRRRRAAQRHPREGLVVAAHRPERDPARREGDRRLPQLDARGHGGEQRRLRGSDHAHARRLRRRRLGREHLRRQGRRASTRRISPPGSSRASRATRSSRSRRTSATRSSRRT